MEEALIGILGAIIGAYGAHLLERSARREERAEAQLSRGSQISPDAFALRRQIYSWLAHWPEHDVKAQGFAQHLSKHLDEAERRATRLAVAASDLTTDQAAAARRAYLLFYEAADFLNDAATGSAFAYSGDQEGSVFVREGSPEFLREARQSFERCVEELTSAIEPALNKVAGDLLQERKSDRLLPGGMAIRPSD